MVFITKPDGGQRPFGLMPMLARIWSRTRQRGCAKWKRSPAGFLGQLLISRVRQGSLAPQQFRGPCEILTRGSWVLLRRLIQVLRAHRALRAQGCGAGVGLRPGAAAGA
eukprot:4255720-Pyramimonas_sp.AAC.1